MAGTIERLSPIPLSRHPSSRTALPDGCPLELSELLSRGEGTPDRCTAVRKQGRCRDRGSLNAAQIAHKLKQLTTTLSVSG